MVGADVEDVEVRGLLDPFDTDPFVRGVGPLEVDFVDAVATGLVAAVLVTPCVCSGGVGPADRSPPKGPKR